MDSLIEGLGRIHRFLSRNLLYPIVLSTGLALILFAGRVFLSHRLAHRNLLWNLFLAWLPYIFSLCAAAFFALRRRRWWLLLIPGSLWLIFFPNAPYIMTDFLHLEEWPRIPLWYDILLLATFAWTGFFLAIASLRIMQIIVKHYMGWLFSWVFAGLALALAGVGIYLGRFSRWNSWDLFLQPKSIAEDVAVRVLNPLNNLGFIGFTMVFTAFLVICYLTFVSIRPLQSYEEDL